MLRVGEGGGGRGAGTRPKRLAPRITLLLLVFLLDELARRRGGVAVDAQAVDGDQGFNPDTEISSYDQDFGREGPYPYQQCSSLPGEIEDGEQRGENDAIVRTARCIPIEAGELEFCGDVEYDACMRVISPIQYDEELALAHDKRIALQMLEFPSLASPKCVAAFASYFCYLGFPQCEEDLDNPGTFIELPLCFDYCVASHQACIGDMEKSIAACDKAVFTGRVAPNRPDVTCVAAGMRVTVGLLCAAMTALSLIFGHRGGEEERRYAYEYLGG